MLNDLEPKLTRCGIENSVKIPPLPIATTRDRSEFMIRGLVSFMLVALFWAFYALCIFKVDVYFPEDSRVGIVIVIFAPVMLIGIGYGLSAFSLWQRLIRIDRITYRSPKFVWLASILLAPAALSLLLVILVFLGDHIISMFF